MSYLPPEEYDDWIRESFKLILNQSSTHRLRDDLEVYAKSTYKEDKWKVEMIEEELRRRV